MAAKTANVYIRVEPELKEKAEAIFSQLGISASAAVNMYYNQVVRQRGLPFQATTLDKPKSISEMSPDEFQSIMQEGVDAANNGNTKPASEVFSALREKYQR